jgi:hypothetical protein
MSGSRLKKSKLHVPRSEPDPVFGVTGLVPMKWKLLRTSNVLSFIVRGIKMAGHQDARYIPPRREQDRSPRGWQDRFAIRRLVLAAVVMVVVALVTFMLIYGHA